MEADLSIVLVGDATEPAEAFDKPTLAEHCLFNMRMAARSRKRSPTLGMPISFKIP